jgi:predicted metal-dependent hydrolase
MPTRLKLGDIAIDVIRKEIKNVHLSVHPPTGRVRVAAPRRMTLDVLRVFAIAKLPWIRKQQKKLREQKRDTPREYIDRESHYVWGSRYLLKVVVADEKPAIEISGKRLVLRMRPGTSPQRRETILEEWQREQLHNALPPLIDKWQKLLKVQVSGYFVQRMKTIELVPSGSIQTSRESRASALNTSLSTKWFIYWSRPTMSASLRSWISTCRSGSPTGTLSTDCLSVTKNGTIRWDRAMAVRQTAS